MKQIQRVIIVLVALTGQVWGFNSRFSQQSVYKESQRISRRMAHDRLIGRAVIATVLGYQAFQAWYYLSAASNVLHAPAEPTEITASTSLLKGVLSLPKQLISSMQTKAFWKSVAQFIGQGLGWAVEGFCIDWGMKNLVHPDSMAWYMKTHAPYHFDVHVALSYITMYQEGKESDKEALWKLSEGACQFVKSDLRRLIAFMVYKLDFVPRNTTPAVALLIETSMRKSQEWSISLCDALNRRDTQEIVRLLKEIDTQMKEYLSLFVRYERACKKGFLHA